VAVETDLGNQDAERLGWLNNSGALFD
jgi:hypothetical protein